MNNIYSSKINDIIPNFDSNSMISSTRQEGIYYQICSQKIVLFFNEFLPKKILHGVCPKFY